MISARSASRVPSRSSRCLGPSCRDLAPCGSARARHGVRLPASRPRANCTSHGASTDGSVCGNSLFFPRASHRACGRTHETSSCLNCCLSRSMSSDTRTFCWSVKEKAMPFDWVVFMTAKVGSIRFENCGEVAAVYQFRPSPSSQTVSSRAIPVCVTRFRRRAILQHGLAGNAQIRHPVPASLMLLHRRTNRRFESLFTSRRIADRTRDRAELLQHLALQKRRRVFDAKTLERTLGEIAKELS